MPINDPFSEDASTINDPFKDIVDPFSDTKTAPEGRYAGGYKRQVQEAFERPAETPEPKSMQEIGKAYKEIGKGAASAVGQALLAPVELIPGLGSSAAKAEKELKGYGDPAAQKVTSGLLYAAPVPFTKGKALAGGLSAGKRVLESILAGAKTGGVAGLITPSYEESPARYVDKALTVGGGSILGGALGLGITGGPAAYGAAKNYLNKLLGREASAAEIKLIQDATAAGKDAINRLTQEEKIRLGELQREADRKTSAVSAGEKAETKAKEALAGPTAKTEEYLGEFTKAPQTMDQIGTFIRDRVNSFVGNIKKQRNLVADRDLTEAMANAAKREKEGVTPGILPSVGGAARKGFPESEKMVELRGLIDSKLATETDQALRSQLMQVRNALFGTGERGAAPSFASSETIRRKIGDAAFGVPEEGYAAIGQNLSKELYGKLSDAMKTFEPSFAKYLDNYKRLSENIETVGTKLGKSLVGVEKDAPGYFAVAAGKIPDKVFSSPENVKILVESMGGNKEPVLAAAERYIANKMAEKKTLEGAREFLNKDATKSLLKELGPEFERRIKDKYLAEATAMTGRKQALEQTIKQADEKIDNINKALEGIRSRTTKLDEGLAAIDAALTKDLKQKATSDLVATLEKELPPQDAARLKALVEEYKEASSAKGKAVEILGKTVGYGALSALGVSGAYAGGKYLTRSAFGED